MQLTVFEALEIEIPFTASDAFAPVTASVSPKLEGSEVDTVKLEALPEESLTTESRAPFASVTTVAVTPRASALMALARLLSVFTPLPMVMVVALPPAGVMVSVPLGRSVEALATVVEAQESVVARLFTVTALLPAVVPEAEVAPTTVGFRKSRWSRTKAP